jgi:hypothetical protein
MIRRATVIALAFTLIPTLLHAQDTAFTVTVPSAEVHAGPSTANPVIGHAPSGTVLPVSRNLGSWVRVAWPGGQDGVGYVHVTMGRIDTANRATRATPPTAPPATRPPSSEPVVARAQPARPLVLSRPSHVVPASHIFGVGGLVAPMSSFGGTARMWQRERLGIQVGVTREATTSAVAAGRVTSVQIEPGVVYALFDRVSDYVWIRPYVGSVLSISHQTLTIAESVTLASASDNGVGFRLFGGSELTFASVPRFGLSADLGYRRRPAPFPGFKADKLSASIAGHWYIK